MLRTVFTVGLGSLLILYAVILCVIEGFAWYRFIWVILGIGLILLNKHHISGITLLLYVLAYGAVILSCLFVEYKNYEYINAGTASDADVIILLGCKYPSRAFNWRTEAAAEYLTNHPETSAVASGGQGSDETMPEGEAYRTKLLERGIADDRIQTESQSTTTRENLLNSDRLYQLKKKRVGIVTSCYHIYRSVLIAEQCGYTDVFGIPGTSLLFYEPDNILREVLALGKAIVFK